MKPSDFTPLVVINQCDLAVEIAEHPKHFNDICTEHVEAKSRRAGAEIRVKDTQRRLWAAAFTVLKDQDASDRRPTEVQVNNFIANDPELVVAKLALSQTIRQEDAWMALREVWTQRSFMFKALVDLHVSGLAGTSRMQPKRVQLNQPSSNLEVPSTGQQAYDLNREHLAQARADRNNTTREQFDG